MFGGIRSLPHSVGLESLESWFFVGVEEEVVILVFPLCGELVACGIELRGCSEGVQDGVRMSSSLHRLIVSASVDSVALRFIGSVLVLVGLADCFEASSLFSIATASGPFNFTALAIFAQLIRIGERLKEWTRAEQSIRFVRSSSVCGKVEEVDKATTICVER